MHREDERIQELEKRVEYLQSQLKDRDEYAGSKSSMSAQQDHLDKSLYEQLREANNHVTTKFHEYENDLKMMTTKISAQEQSLKELKAELSAEKWKTERLEALILPQTRTRWLVFRSV